MTTRRRCAGTDECERVTPHSAYDQTTTFVKEPPRRGELATEIRLGGGIIEVSVRPCQGSVLAPDLGCRAVRTGVGSHPPPRSGVMARADAGSVPKNIFAGAGNEIYRLLLPLKL